MKKRDIVLILGSISFLVLVTFLSLLLADKFQVRGCGCPRVVSHNFIWLFISLAVIFVGSLLYYLFSLKIDEKEKFIDKNMEIVYSILDKDEKNVLNKIIKNKGEIEQSLISKEYDKIKAHRIIKKLQEKRIVEIVKEGKTNTIKLNKDLEKELVK
jgi:hypothetical protein